MKRYLCFILIVMFAISLAACNKEALTENNNTRGITNATDSTGNGSGSVELSQFEVNFPSYDEIHKQYPEKTILVWTIQETGYEHRYPFRTMEVNEYLDSKNCDYAICFLPLSYASTAPYPDTYVATVEEMIRNGAQIDIISPMNYEEFVSNGLYTQLDEYFKTESGKELYNSMPEKLWESLRINGGIYGINATTLYTLSLDWGYYVNAELAEKYGYDVTKSIVDQIDILRSVKENEKKIDVFSTYLRISNIVHSTDVKQIVPGIYWNEEIHSAECVLDNPQYIEKLKLYDILNRNGLLNDMSKTSDSFFIFQENIPGGIVYDSTKTVKIYYYGNIVNAIPVFNEQTSIRNCPVATGICSSSQNKEKAFELLSLIYTDSVLNNLLTFGIEGVDYNCEENKADTVINPFNTIRFANDLICHQYDNSSFADEQYREIYENALVHEDWDFSFDGRELAEEICAVTEIMSNFSLPKADSDSEKEKNLDEVLDETRKQLEQVGLCKIINECNRQYEEYRNERD